MQQRVKGVEKWGKRFRYRISWYKERDSQKQQENSKISAARYNGMYKQLTNIEGGLSYLRRECIEKETADEVRALVTLKCGNMGEREWILERGEK